MTTDGHPFYINTISNKEMRLINAEKQRKRYKVALAAYDPENKEVFSS